MNLQHRTKQHQSGSAVIVVLILLFLMLAFSMANTRSLSNLKTEIQMMEKQQIKRFESAATNEVSTPSQKR